MIGKGSRIGLGWTVGKLVGRRMLYARVTDKDIELGDALTDQLDQMKGLAMKLGQIVSYMDVPLPEVVQERLTRLQTGVTGLSGEETKRALAVALGEAFLERFDSFELHPFAAASIGQVHRARYGGQDIVLKLQYPHVSGGFRDDLSKMGRFASLASLASAVDGQAIVHELAERLDEECDYRREARSQSTFRRAFGHDPDIVIPEVIEHVSTSTTLATVFAEGVDYTVAARYPAAVRTRLAHALIRFSYQSLLEYCAIQADPHPGNFKFTPEGRVVCLDFGCVRTFEPEFVQQIREMISAIDRKRPVAFRDAVIALGIAPRPDKFHFDEFFTMMEHLHRPLLCPSFHFTADFVKQGLTYNGPTNKNARTMNMPPPYIWVARLQWGLWSLLARLDASVEARPLLEALLEASAKPLFSYQPGDTLH